METKMVTKILVMLMVCLTEMSIRDPKMETLMEISIKELRMVT